MSRYVTFYYSSGFHLCAVHECAFVNANMVMQLHSFVDNEFYFNQNWFVVLWYCRCLMFNTLLYDVIYYRAVTMATGCYRCSRGCAGKRRIECSQLLWAAMMLFALTYWFVRSILIVVFHTDRTTLSQVNAKRIPNADFKARGLVFPNPFKPYL